MEISQFQHNTGQEVTYYDRLLLKCNSIIITLYLVKAIVFPVVTYGCESWTIKKAEHRRIVAFEMVLEKTLESPLDCKETQPVNPKGSQS